MGYSVKIDAESAALWQRWSQAIRAAKRIAWSALATATRDFFQDGIPDVSAAITFYMLLALAPAIACFVSLYGLFADVHTAQMHLAYLRGLLPDRGLDVIGQEMLRIAALRSDKLGLTFAISFAVSLWSANAGTKGLIDGLNRAYEEKETRSFLAVTLRSLAFTMAALLVSFAILSFAAIPLFSRQFPSDVADTLDALRWIALIVVGLACLIVIYRFGPDGRRGSWAGIVPGAVTAIVVWIVASEIFSLYVANFAHYNRTYGQLGAVIGFLMWIWLSLMVVLFGAELNAVLEQRTAKG